MKLLIQDWPSYGDNPWLDPIDVLQRSRYIISTIQYHPAPITSKWDFIWPKNDSRWRSTSVNITGGLKTCSIPWEFLRNDDVQVEWISAPKVPFLTMESVCFHTPWMVGFVCKVTFRTCCEPACRFGCQFFGPLLGKNFIQSFLIWGWWCSCLMGSWFIWAHVVHPKNL